MMLVLYCLLSWHQLFADRILFQHIGYRLFPATLFSSVFPALSITLKPANYEAIAYIEQDSNDYYAYWSQGRFSLSVMLGYQE